MYFCGSASFATTNIVSCKRLRELTQAVASLDVRDAKAHQRADEDLIKKLILNDIGFDAVNHAVRSRLVEEFKSLFGELFLPR